VENATNKRPEFSNVASGRRSTGLSEEARELFAREPELLPVLSIGLEGISTDEALLAAVLASAITQSETRSAVGAIVLRVFQEDPVARASALADIAATARKNFEPGGDIATLLFSRGIHALLAHRVTHSLWCEGRVDLALALKTIFGRAFSTDIHPAARFGRGIWLDHGLGFVVGETAIVEDDVSIWHGVTLGSTLKESGAERHPRLRRGATIGAGAVILGGIEIGAGSVVAAGSVVLTDVAPGTTVAGVPAKLKARSASSFAGF
jgi:serine O-acetyltransferase